PPTARMCASRWVALVLSRFCYSGRSESARRGTTNDTRKIGKNLFPVHRKATTWPSASSKFRVRLRFRPLRTCRGVMSSFDWYLDRVVHFDRPDTLTVDHDIVRTTTDLHS